MVVTAAHLVRFAPPMAGLVANWVRTEAELFTLAPSSAFPLDAEKVIGWTSRRGEAFMLVESASNRPVGYGEVNPMRGEPRVFWLGHLLIDPRRRGQGWGRVLTEALLDASFREKRARRVVLVVFPENKAALTCYEHCGFRRVREEHHAFPGREGHYRMLRLDLDRTRYAAQIQKPPHG